MINEEHDLKLLVPNKSVFFNSPLEDVDTCLSRSGVINDDNNSFLHAVLGSYSKDYFNLSKEQKIKFFDNFKKTIFTKKNWKNTKKEYIYFVETFCEAYSSIYKNIKRFNSEKDKDKYKNILDNIKSKVSYKTFKNTILKNIELYDLIFELIGFDKLRKNILKDSSLKDYSILSYKNNINKNIIEYLDSLELLKKTEFKRSEFIKNAILKLFNEVLDLTENIAFKIYLNKIDKIVCNKENINILSERLKRNIYFIDSYTRMPYLYDKSQIFKNDKSIIIIKIKDNFEIIGKLYKQNKIKRDFESDDLLIKKINIFLFNPENVKDIYPQLIEYLPDEYKYYPHSEDDDDKDFEEYEPKDELEKETFNKILNQKPIKNKKEYVKDQLESELKGEGDKDEDGDKDVDDKGIDDGVDDKDVDDKGVDDKGVDDKGDDNKGVDDGIDDCVDDKGDDDKRVDDKRVDDKDVDDGVDDKGDNKDVNDKGEDDSVDEDDGVDEDDDTDTDTDDDDEDDEDPDDEYEHRSSEDD